MIEHKVDDIIIYNTNKVFDTVNKEELSDCIAKWIVDNIEYEIINEILEKNYEGFTMPEKYVIFDKICSILKTNKENRLIGIKTIIDKYLKDNYILNIQGFTRFRLKEYRRFLEHTVDDIIEKYIVEKEYNEFIELIKEYISYEESFVNELNIFKIKKKFVFLDGSLTDISQQLEEKYLYDNDLNEDDRLLTILILSNPKNIIWHQYDGKENKELIYTIKRVFVKRFVLCNNCNICRKILKNRLDF